MGAFTVLTGLAATYYIPGNYVEVQFGVGGGSAGNATYGILLLGNKLSAGSATVDTVVYGPNSPTPMATEADVIALFGVGSELHRQWRRVYAVNQVTPIFALAVTESVGANATGAFTLATTATGAGTLRTYVGDEYVDTPIAIGDTPTAVAARAVLNINGITRWPVTAGNSSGVLTLTAKQKGLRGNWLRFWTRIFPSTGMTTTATAPAFFTGGTTADSSTTALGTILGTRYYYIASAAEDATQAGALLSQVTTQALPTNGIRQRVFVGSVDTLANATTIATGLNGARAELTLQLQGDVPPAELAANAAAVYALEEAPVNPRLNFSSYGLDNTTAANWKIKPPNSGATLTPAQINAALTSGISVISTTPNGQATYLVDRLTTHSLNGSNPDTSIRDPHKVTVSDRYADDWVAKCLAQFQGKSIGDDPPPNQPGPGPSVVTPRVFKAAVNKLTQDYGDRDLLQRTATIIANTISGRDQSVPTRMTAQVPLQVVDVLKQTATLIQQVA